MVLNTVQHLAQADGLSFSSEEIIQMLAQVIDEGLAKAYKCVDANSRWITVPFSAEDQNVYFFLTAEGKRFQAL